MRITFPGHLHKIQAGAVALHEPLHSNFGIGIVVLPNNCFSLVSVNGDRGKKASIRCDTVSHFKRSAAQVHISSVKYYETIGSWLGEYRAIQISDRPSVRAVQRRAEYMGALKIRTGPIDPSVIITDPLCRIAENVRVTRLVRMPALRLPAQGTAEAAFQIRISEYMDCYSA